MAFVEKRGLRSSQDEYSDVGCWKRLRRCLCFMSLAVSLMTQTVTPGQAQGLSGTNSGLAPINLNVRETQLAQVAPPQFIPTDVTPFSVAPERNNFSPGYKFRIFQSLPERLWFNSTTEVSQRLDTNVFFTYSHPKADYAFRILPNVTVGYNVLKNTSIYANYFVIKDLFAEHTMLNFPTTQSVSWGLQHNIALGRKTNLQLDFQARELWQTSHLRQFDFLPGATVTHVLNPNNIVFGSTLLQLRGGDYFVAPTRDNDPFYTLGYLYKRGAWNLVVNDTLVTNFRHPPFNDSIPRQSNVSMIADIEVNRPIIKTLPALVAFVRAEPIWNWDSHKAPGLSGFDFRLYGGLRLSVSKPSYYGAMDNMRKQIMESENLGPPGSSKGHPTSVNPNNGNTVGSASDSASGPINSTDSDNEATSSGVQGKPKLKGI